MDHEKPLTREFYVGIAMGIILSLLTCGIYNVYWNRKQFQAMNLLLGREEYKFVTWLAAHLAMDAGSLRARRCDKKVSPLGRRSGAPGRPFCLCD